MRKLVLLLAAVVALSLTGLAQTSSQEPSSGSQESTTTTTKTTKHAKHAKSEAGETAAQGSEKSAKQSQLTGCLAKDASGSGYMLTNGRYKKGVEVKSSEDLSAHVGHEVKLMGNWEKPTSGAAGGAGAKGETMRTFNASKVDHVSDTCKMAGSKGKKDEKATPPSGF